MSGGEWRRRRRRRTETLHTALARSLAPQGRPLKRFGIIATKLQTRHPIGTVMDAGPQLQAGADPLALYVCSGKTREDIEMNFMIYSIFNLFLIFY